MDWDEERPYEIEVLNSSLDLETFVTSYSGLGILYRLLFVAKHAPPLSIEALRIAHTLILKTMNAGSYSVLLSLWHGVCTDRPDSEQPPPANVEWLEMTKKSISMREERLDNDLKHFKTNSIKESVRKTYEELGDFHLQSGDLPQSLKCYARMRDYCGTSLSVVAMCLNIVRVSLYQQCFSNAVSYINKANTAMVGTGTPTGSQTMSAWPMYKTSLFCARGVAELALGNFKSAAAAFLEAVLDNFSFSEVLSSNNVAVYGGLCALATYSRTELQQQVLTSSSFKLFLELEPQVRDVLFKFHQSKYSVCLRTLAEMRDNLHLDIYLSRHVDTLYGMIRQKAMVQYFSPYQCVSLHKMAEAFNTSVEAIEDEVATLLLNDEIDGKIDSQEKVLYSTNFDQRVTTFTEAIKLGDVVHHSTQALVLHCALVKHKVGVQPYGGAVRADTGEVAEPITSSRRR